ncbi:HNH endonuclease [Streptomyces sp. PmtG]
MPKCPPDCTCGRHVSYARTADHRAAISARTKGVAQRPLAERFWKKVDKRGLDECWPWTGACYKQGYGKLYAGRNEQGSAVFYRAHRIAWELANGEPVPAGLYVLHACDTPACVSPRHLRVGTTAENNGDRADRRRGKEHRQRGAANDNAKLTEDQVRQIITELQRLPRRSQASIAEQFGIKQPQVSRIMRRESWGHLWDE